MISWSLNIVKFIKNYVFIKIKYIISGNGVGNIISILDPPHIIK